MKLLTNLDLTGQELQNARVQNLATAPGIPAAGRLYYDTAINKLVYWNNTVWVNADGSSIPDNTVTSAKIVDGTIVNIDINNAAGIALSKLATDPLARGNHTGTQAASSISDFNTVRDLQRLDQHVAPTAAVDLGSQKITNLATPTLDTDATNKIYVDSAINGLDWKASVRAATIANITLSGLLTIDGVTLIAGNRVLVKDQTTASGNGIYVAASGAWTRATDSDSNAEVTSGMATFIEEGTLNGNQQWALSTDNPITLGTTALVFAQIGSQGVAPIAGAGLTLAANTYDVGQGTGISVTADAIAIDTAIVVRKFTATIGDGAALAYVITHNLANQWVNTDVVRSSAPFDVVGADIELTSANTVTVRFAVAPTAAQYRVICSG